MSLQKVIIHAYNDKKLNKKTGKFELPINPENFSRNLKIKNEKTQAQASRGTASKLSKVKPEEIKLEFMFDNTGTVEGNKLQGTEVLTQIKKFLQVTYNIKGKIHEPRKIRLNWGLFTFDCKLTDLVINYTLFNSSGNPVRAKLSGTFTEYIEKKKEEAIKNNSSPDLTHVRIAGQEDRLSLMTFDIYGHQKWYLQVAKANGLTSPRLLKKGTELLFPPVEKNVLKNSSS